MTTRLDVSRIWAGNDPAVSVIDPGTEKYGIGWVAEIPAYQHMNYLQYRIDTNLRALAERGMFEWGIEVDYQKGALAWDELDSFVYIAKVNSPAVDKAPSLNPDHWEKSAAQVRQQLLVDLQAELDAHKALKTNPHEVTAIQAGTYTAEEFDDLLAQLGLAIDIHEADTTNPHGVTATQAGAVPISGGAFLGAVDFRHASIELNKGSGGRTKRIDGTSGMLITMDNWALGLNAAGTAIWREGGTEYPLLFLHEYQTLKDAAEPSYAVPEPDFYMPLVSDTNIYRGVGTSSYVGSAGRPYVDKGGVSRVSAIDEPVFEVAGLKGASSDTRLSLDADVLAGYDDFTVFLEADAKVNWALELGGQLGIGTYFWLGGQFGDRTPTGVHKLCMVRKNTQVSAYVDGVLWATKVSTQALSAAVDVGHYNGNVRNLKIWATGLTAKQVSTL